MPKRFTITEKWSDEWFMCLTPQAKVIWEYLRDNCDIAGVFELNVELMRFRIKFSPQVDIVHHINELNEVAHKLGMEDRIEWFADNRRLWIKNFIKIQYGVLSPKVATHRGVIKIIENHKHNKQLPKSLEGLVTLKVKDKDKYIKNSSKKKVSNKPNIPFEDFWNAYDKKRDKGESETKWKNLTDADRTAIMEYIPKYKESQPIKQYRKDPKTFLHNRSWEDEIIVSNLTVAQGKQNGNDYLEQRRKDEEKLKSKLGVA